jgi:creatinine amidohydrolase
MRLPLVVVGLSVVLAASVAARLAAGAAGWQAVKPPPGVALTDLSWVDAEPVLTASAVVVIPLGAAVLEQGPHLKLNSDERLVRHLASRVQAASSVVIAPPLTYHAYPEFAEYPGTASLTPATAQAMTVDVVRGLAKHGPRRFYILNTEPSALPSLSAAAKSLADAGILLGYTDPRFRLRPRALQLWPRSLAAGHADEVATSMMLFVDPSAVDMTRAVREYAQGTGSLTRQEGGPGVVSKTGVLGDATLATRANGQALLDTLVAAALEDIEAVRTAPLPAIRPAATPPPARVPAPRPGGQSDEEVLATGCTAGEERSIRQIGMHFSANWKEMDAPKIAAMFMPRGDMRHPDGNIERGREVILTNRFELFRRKEYQGSSHSLQLNDIRCPLQGLAIADGKWDLRLIGIPNPYRGWCTLLLQRSGGGWQIEAWRYTVDPPPNTTPPPTILKKPGWPGGPGGE